MRHTPTSNNNSYVTVGKPNSIATSSASIVIILAQASEKDSESQPALDEEAY